MGLSEDRLRQVLTWLVIALLVVPVGGALYLGVAHGESPCILCWAQRTSMILMALVALFVVRYGPRPRYLGVLILLGVWGIWMATRHSSLHVARDIGQGFAANILGAHTYVWAWVIHWVVLIVAGVLLVAYRGPIGEADSAGERSAGERSAGERSAGERSAGERSVGERSVGERDDEPRTVPGRAGRFAMGLFVVLVAGNAVQAFISTGPPPFLGQGDPIRMSLDPEQWVWSMGEYRGPLGWRGSWAVERPDPAEPAVDPDPANGPLAGLETLPVERRARITAPVDGRITGLAVAPAPSVLGDEEPAPEASPGHPRGVLLTTDDFGVYVLDGALTTVLHHVAIDPGFSIDVTPLAGTAFLGPDTLAIGTVNKSYLLLRPDPDADPVREFRHFLETTGDVTELRRSRFATVRARVQYASSLAYDPGASELITVSVPSEHYPRWVVSRFDRDDFVLSSEFVPELGSGLTLSGEGRGLAEYVVTGATVMDGRLYVMSAAYSTLLVIDLESKAVTAAYAVAGLEAPVGLAAFGDELWIAQADGRVAVVARP